MGLTGVESRGKSPQNRGDRGLQSASEANGAPEHSLAPSLSTKCGDKVRRRSVKRLSVETKCGDEVWRQGVPPGGERAAQRFYPLNCEPLSGRNNCHCHCLLPSATGRRKGGAALLPSNCEPLCGRNNRPCPLPLPTAAAPTGAVGVTEPRTLTPDPRRRRRQESAGSRAFSQKAFLMLQTGGSFCIVGLFLRGSGAIG